MKTEYKEVKDLLALEDQEILHEFEMVELKGGKFLSNLGTNWGCQEHNGPGCQCKSNTLCICRY